jgi:glucosamine-6-phosphate deaminase
MSSASIIASQKLKFDLLEVEVFPSQEELAISAAARAAGHIKECQRQHEDVHLILATGNSQIKFLSQLQQHEGIDWGRMVLFHMDEYLGISPTHPASFRHYMKEKVEKKFAPKRFHYLEGDCLEPLQECARYEALLREKPIDLCCLGIGENGHLAFNDPPVANFYDSTWVKLVKLDEACKLQQVNEGHFPGLDAVPPYALTLTIPALCAARKMICISPEKRKAIAVKAALQGPISTECPASILRQQSHAQLLLDEESAALLTL